MSKGVHNIAFYVSPDPECSRTTQNSEISLAPSRGRILYAIYGNSTCVINHIVVTAIDKRYRNYYVSTKIILQTTFIVVISALPSRPWPVPSSLSTRRMANSALYKTIAVLMISLSRMPLLSLSSLTSLTSCIMPATSPSSTFVGDTTTFVSVMEMSGKQLLKHLWVYLNHSS